jgi:hypothetical protein
VSEPEGDHRPVDAMLKEFRGGGVAENVRGHSLAYE